MKTYDAIIIGAGPAGGNCARALSKSGWRVLLAEKASGFAVKDFSSGGAPLEILSNFDLPESVVGSFCHQIKITTSHDAHLWAAKNPVGLVLDFKKLRTFLAEDAKKNGAHLHFEASFKEYKMSAGKITVSFKDSGNAKIKTFQARVLIDATGSERRVLMGERQDKQPNHKPSIVGCGLEYLVEVPEAIYRQYAGCLSFFIGLKWMPQGYAWIFPMTPHRLKIGVGRNFPGEMYVAHHQSMQHYLDQVIARCLKTEKVTVLDRHGKTLSYTCHQRDRYFEQNVIAIGDAVSTVNPLTFEGIRHAMKSGEIAAKHTDQFLSGRRTDFRAYRSEMRAYSGIKWAASEILTKKIYREPDDEKVSLMLDALKRFTLYELKHLVFYTTLKSAMRFYAIYHLLLAKRVVCFWKKPPHATLK